MTGLILTLWCKRVKLFVNEQMIYGRLKTAVNHSEASVNYPAERCKIFLRACKAGKRENFTASSVRRGNEIDPKSLTA